MWLEMSRDEEHGGKGWGFTECLWSPSHKNPSGRWAFWDTLLAVKKDDVVIHLRGKTHNAAFVGYSIADLNGYETRERPPSPSMWAYATSFYRVPLVNFTPFSNPVKLDDVFSECKNELIQYFYANNGKAGPYREHLFYVIQAGRLQCLNGAYLSNFSNDLANIIFGPYFGGAHTQVRPPRITAKTSEQLVSINSRIGQKEFSDNVRNNYGNQCCFPGCSVKDSYFLVGSHIARWADAPELRGNTTNGLCLCLFHDKAFELGLFTLTKDFRVRVNYSKAKGSDWAKASLIPFEGQGIKAGSIPPSFVALEYHWRRTGFPSP